MSFTGIILAVLKFWTSVMLLLLSFIAQSIIRYLAKQIITDQKENRSDTVKPSVDSQSDAEHEIFLFNESSFANLFESSKFNSIAEKSSTFSNFLSQSEKSFKLLGTDEDFYSELEHLKNFELDNYDLEAYLDQTDLAEASSLASSPRFNSLMNSVTSMDLEINDDLKDMNSMICSNIEDDFYNEENKLINESIIASCTLTNDALLNSSSSNISESSSLESVKNSTPTLRIRRTLRTNLLISRSNSTPMKAKKFLPKCERNRIANKFYRRNRTSSQNVTNMSKLKLASYKQPTKVEKLLNDSRGMRKYLIDYDGLMTHQKKNLTNLTFASLLNMTSNSTGISSVSSPKLGCEGLRSVSCPMRFSRVFNSTGPSLNKSLIKSKYRNSPLGKARWQSGNRFSSNRSSSGYLTDC